MRREFHVQFCEGAGVRLPRATRPLMLFANEADARKVMEVLSKRMGRYGLNLHPEKTRLVPFKRPTTKKDRDGGAGPGTFELLGFRHLWARSRNGYWVVKQQTATSRMSRALNRIRQWCRSHRHQPLQEQFQKLSQKLRGHYAYYGITGNSGALSRFRQEVTRIWKKWLGRRSRERDLTWRRLTAFLTANPLPAARIVHHPAANP